MRYGETAGFEEQPHSPYYGSADATPLFVVLLDEYERWTGDVALVKELERESRAALKWIDNYADLVGNGYIWYERRNTETGLENQCWKDSWDSISYADGSLPPFPRATCEVQGYAYDAKVRGARMARRVLGRPGVRRPAGAGGGGAEGALQPGLLGGRTGEYYALALDPDGRQCDSLTSNIGHLLWSGIVDRARAETGRRAPGRPPALLRLGRPHPRRGGGPVQPDRLPQRHDLAVRQLLHRLGPAPLRLPRGGRHDRHGILDAATYFDGRLPEAFGGYPRELTKFPVEYPTACSPQAWSTGTPAAAAADHARPGAARAHLTVEPLLPVGMGRIEVLDIPGRWGRVDALGRSRTPHDHEHHH